MYCAGLKHSSHTGPTPGSNSIAHSKYWTSSLAWISKVAQLSIETAGGPVRIVVSGGVESMPTSNAREAGGCSTLSARSIARTRNTWLPGVRSLYSIGESHCSNGCESSWHSKLETGSLALKLAM